MVKAKNNKLANNVKKKAQQQQKQETKDQKKNAETKVEVEGIEDEEVLMENDTNMLIYEKKETDELTMEPVKRKLSRKERIRLEKIVEKKEKTSRRADLLEKLSAFQVNKNELNMYSSVKSIGQKEKKSHNDMATVDETGGKMTVNSIAGGNRKKRKFMKGQESEESDKSIDTDDMSSDSDVDDGYIQKALENYKKSAEESRIASLNLDRLEKKSKREEMNGDGNKKKKDMPSDEEAVVETATGTSRPTKYVHVDRREEIKESRSKLPIITEEQVIMEKIAENDITIICGETGSGKTTQVPQFLYEAGYASDGQMIGITEPRRVAAIAMSKRVNDEMNFEESEQIVSFQIRYEGNYSPNTKLKFMTDGVLLKEVQTDFMLTKYSALIIDEAHERSVYTDILIGLLSRIVPLRSKRGNPLKLIIMSATLRVEDFTENRRLFKNIPPQIKVEARQFDVGIHFNKHTYEDYLSEAYKKVCKIHERLPEGGILVFLTGQQEVNVLCNKLRRTYPNTPVICAPSGGTGENGTNNGDGADDNDDQSLDETADFKNNKSRKRKRAKKSNEVKEINIKDAPKVNLDSYSIIPLEDQLEMDLSDDDEEEMDHQFDLNENSDDDEDFADELGNKKSSLGGVGGANKPLYVLPLYSLLSSEKQQRVFDKVPENCRLCVVATNVAETSLTIPNIKYVVDSGKIKMKFYDKVTGVSTFRICWTSKASAEQRSGRAGRTAPGHCYRLFSSAVFNDEFPKFAEPEIVRKPVEDLILQMKDLGIDRIVNFPFPTPPDDMAIKVAEKLLIRLGALEVDKSRSKSMKQSEQVTRISELGKVIASFPINPRYGKMLTLASQQEDKSILSYVICMISGLSVAELFIDGETVIEQKPKENEDKTTESADKPICSNMSLKEQQRAEADAIKAKRAQTATIKVKYSQMRQSWLNGVPDSNTMLLGDLMLLLVALGAVEYEQHQKAESMSSEQRCMNFCQQYGIRYKAIVEARKLRKQLVNTVNIIFPAFNLSIDPLMPPPSQEQAKLIRQIVLSGMVDRVAKRYDYVIHDKEGKELKNAYQGMLLEDAIFIHPSSVLFKQLPQYVCYVEMVETSKLYMKGVSSIESDWLAKYLGNQCNFDKPLVNETDPEYEQRKPRFDSKQGIVVCHRASTFSNVMWKLKPVEVEFPESLELYKWFARYLLEGEVIEGLKKYQPVLLASPSTMLKSWAKLQQKTEQLLNALIKEKCSSRERLLSIWSTKPDYLINEYTMWLPESVHFEIRLKWPPVEKKQ